MLSSKRLTFSPAAIISYLWPIFLITGLLVRLVVFFQNRSLFLDEANLARNIAEISFRECFQPLAYQQYAPPLFLLLEKINWYILGASGLSLRFWPLVMGCLALSGMYFLLKRMSAGGLSGLFVFYLFAFSQVYIRYSTELKQYSTDMAVSTGLMLAALSFLPRGKKQLWIWILLGSVSIWLSMPSVFMLAGIGAYFAYEYWTKQAVPVANLFVLGIVCLANFGLYYWLILGNDLQKTELLSYHQPFFWPLLPLQAADWQRLWDISQSLISTLIGHTFLALTLGITGLVGGLVKLWKQERAHLWILVVPVLLCLLASGLGYYSLMERLSLFMMPLLGLILFKGLPFPASNIRRSGQLLLLLLGLSVLPLRKGITYFFQPLHYEEMRPLLMALDQYTTPSDLIWVDHYAEPAFRWYTQYDPLPLELTSRPPRRLFNRWDGIAVEELNGTAPTQGYTWLIFSHLVSDFNRQEMHTDLDLMRAAWGEPEIELRYPGVAAFRW